MATVADDRVEFANVCAEGADNRAGTNMDARTADAIARSSTVIARRLRGLGPRTTVLGAILVTGYLGGATATQVRVGDPWCLFPVALGVMAWAGLWCRSPRIRALLPLMR
jgi:hypothetical protein